MRGLEGAVECLRPFVENRLWDYCVVWKLGDDPTRFVEWLGCCCAGGYVNAIKKEQGDDPISDTCKDKWIKHPRRTMACEALAQYPSSIPLYSGVHGEVAVSTQPRWLITHPNASVSSSSHVEVGTQVLIPVIGGLVELFAAKHVQKDESMIELVTALCVSIEAEAITAQSYTRIKINENPLNPLIDLCLQSGPEPFPSCSYDLQSWNLTSIGETTYSNLEGSSGTSQRSDRQKYHAKNLFTERNRRNRINDGLLKLRALVPKITKMDKAAILGDAIDYIGQLKQEEKELQDELRKMEEEDTKEKTVELKSDRLSVGNSDLTTSKNHSSNSNDKNNQEVLVEVHQIGKREFLIKFIWEKQGGGFVRLMEALHLLGLQAVDVSVTTFNGRVLNVLRVEGCKKGIQLNKLRDTLVELTRQTNYKTAEKFEAVEHR